MKRAFAIVIISSLFVVGSLFAQEYAGKFGLMVSTNSSISYSNIGFTYWFNDFVSIEPIFGFQNMSSGGNTSSTFAPGARLIYHLSNNKLKPYAGVGASFLILSSNNETYTDNMISGLYGAEYFISKWFSLGGEFQLNVLITNKDYSPSGYPVESTIIRTASVIILRFYLK